MRVPRIVARHTELWTLPRSERCFTREFAALDQRASSACMWTATRVRRGTHVATRRQSLQKTELVGGVKIGNDHWQHNQSLWPKYSRLLLQWIVFTKSTPAAPRVICYRFCKFCAFSTASTTSSQLHTGISLQLYSQPAASYPQPQLVTKLPPTTRGAGRLLYAWCGVFNEGSSFSTYDSATGCSPREGTANDPQLQLASALARQQAAANDPQ
jgi:hypothetical protein